MAVGSTGAGRGSGSLRVGHRRAVGDPWHTSTPPVAIASARMLDTVAILAFTADTEEDRFLADGLADDLEIRLAEVSGLRTLAQSETAVVSGAQSPTEAARLLDASYVVTGSVRQSASQLAISLRLIDAADGATIWADRYEGARDGMLAFRNTVPDALVSAMAIDLNRTDHERLVRQDTTDPDAFEDVLKARRALSLFTYEGSLAAERHLRSAIARDPDYARAHAELAVAFVIRMENDWIVLSKADTDKAFYFAEAALRLDPDLWFAHYALGRLHSVADTGDVEAAFRHLQRAMALQPDEDDPRIYYAIVRMMSGYVDEARRIFESVLATHPQPPFWYYLGYSHALFHQGRVSGSSERHYPLPRPDAQQSLLHPCTYRDPGENGTDRRCGVGYRGIRDPRPSANARCDDEGCDRA